MPVQVGVADWRLPVRGADAVVMAARAGADGVALDLGGSGRGPDLGAPGRVDRVSEACARTGIRPLALAANHLNDLGITAEPHSVTGRRVRRLVEHLLDTASALGAPLVIVPSFRSSSITNRTDLDLTAVMLSWAAREAAARGLILAHENVLSATDALWLARRVGSDALRFQLDTWNPVAAQLDVPGLVAALDGRWADQVHLKDGPPVTGRTPPLGQGVAEISATLAAFGALVASPVRALIVEGDYRSRADQQTLCADVSFARKMASGVPGLATPLGSDPRWRDRGMSDWDTPGRRSKHPMRRVRR